jgi:hypothetical protein
MVRAPRRADDGVLPAEEQSMKIFRTWFSRRRQTRCARRAVVDYCSSAPAPDDAPPKGCAWYDSSLDLKRGLLVLEAPALLRG